MMYLYVYTSGFPFVALQVSVSLRVSFSGSVVLFVYICTVGASVITQHFSLSIVIISILHTHTFVYYFCSRTCVMG